MYCIYCGVELSNSEKACPLCGTRVVHPDVPPHTEPAPYPPAKPLPGQWNPKGILFIITVLTLLAGGIMLLCDLRLNHTVGWSGYAIGGVALTYIIAVLPGWFQKPNPVLLVPVDLIAAMLYLLYIDLATKGKWFLPFAFPVVGIIMLLATAVVALCRYMKRGHLFIYGAAFIALGCFTMLFELFSVITFGGRWFVWSIYPLIGCCCLGVMLIIIGLSPTLRESLHKKFFV